MSCFADRLCMLRVARGFTRLQLARALGYDMQSIIAWEEGMHKPCKAIMYDLACYFDVTIEYLTGEVDR